MGCMIPLSVEFPSGIVPFGASVALLTLSSGDRRSGGSEAVADGALKLIVATSRRHSVWVVEGRRILVRRRFAVAFINVETGLPRERKEEYNTIKFPGGQCQCTSGDVRYGP